MQSQLKNYKKKNMKNISPEIKAGLLTFIVLLPFLFCGIFTMIDLEKYAWTWSATILGYFITFSVVIIYKMVLFKIENKDWKSRY